jgi:hypothetical protein
MDEEVTDTRYSVGTGGYEFGFDHTVYPIRGSTPAHSTIHVMLGPWGMRRLTASDAMGWGGFLLTMMVVAAFVVGRKKHSDPAH